MHKGGMCMRRSSMITIILLVLIIIGLSVYIFIDFIKIISNEIAIDINNIFAYKYIKQKAL